MPEIFLFCLKCGQTELHGLDFNFVATCVGCGDKRYLDPKKAFGESREFTDQEKRELKKSEKRA
jgi:hypothetical protein